MESSSEDFWPNSDFRKWESIIPSSEYIQRIEMFTNKWFKKKLSFLPSKNLFLQIISARLDVVTPDGSGGWGETEGLIEATESEDNALLHIPSKPDIMCFPTTTPRKFFTREKGEASVVCSSLLAPSTNLNGWNCWHVMLRIFFSLRYCSLCLFFSLFFLFLHHFISFQSVVNR